MLAPENNSANDAEIQILISKQKDIPFAFRTSKPTCKGSLRQFNSDFQVKEILSFEPSGLGEHLFLQVEKDDCNTEWVIRQLIKKTGLTRKDIGYAGKKDRHSVSQQWFSLHLPGKQEEIDTPEFIDSLNGDGFRIIKQTRHNKKLRVGSILENQFTIILRSLSEDIESSAIKNIAKNGFPNYFGYQRFGRDYNNLVLANELLVTGIKIKNRNKRGLILSSARSFIFNMQLAERVKENTWNREVDGDCFMLNNSHSYFTDTEKKNTSQQSIEERLESGDIHICGWLPGSQETDSLSKSKELEKAVLKNMQGWIDGLSKLGVDSSRRAYRAFAKKLCCEQSGDVATITFSLTSGCYATVLLRELVDFKDASLLITSSD